MIDLPVFVLCLRELPDRTAWVVTRFAEQGIKWKPWWGFCGATMGLATSKPYDVDSHKPTPCATCGNETAYRINPGTVAVTLSHLALLKHIVAAEYPAALIFENDVDLPPDFAERFDAFYRGLPADWDLAYLGWSSGSLEWDADPAHVRMYAPGIRIIPQGSMQTHAYMVSLKGAQFLDEHCQRANWPIDVSYMLDGANRLKHYYAHPKLCEQLTATGRMAGSLHFDAGKFEPVTPIPERYKLADRGDGTFDWVEK